MKRLLVSFVLALAAFVSGCDNDFTTPAGIVRTAYKAIRSDDLDLFVQTLSGDAYARYADQDSLDMIRERILDARLDIGSITPIPMPGNPAHELFTVEVMKLGTSTAGGTAEPYITATVRCWLDECRIQKFWLLHGDLQGD